MADDPIRSAEFRFGPLMGAINAAFAAGAHGIHILRGGVQIGRLGTDADG